MCQQCRYERDFFRASDLTVFVSGQLVRESLPIKVVVPETASDLQMVYSISGAAEEIQLIAPPFFEVDATVSLDKRHSCGENCLLTKLNVPCRTARIANKLTLGYASSLSQLSHNGVLQMQKVQTVQTSKQRVIAAILRFIDLLNKS